MDVLRRLSRKAAYGDRQLSSIDATPLLVMELPDGSKKYILPCYGSGLWGPIWGYVAFDADGGVGLDVGLLTVAQRHGCDRKGASHHHYQHHDIYDRVDVALLVYLHDRTEVLARRSRYVAFDADGETIYGAYFNHKGETPGLGAEIEKPAFSSQFDGKPH